MGAAVRRRRPRRPPLRRWSGTLAAHGRRGSPGRPPRVRRTGGDHLAVVRAAAVPRRAPPASPRRPGSRWCRRELGVAPAGHDRSPVLAAARSAHPRDRAVRTTDHDRTRRGPGRGDRQGPCGDGVAPRRDPAHLPGREPTQCLVGTRTPGRRGGRRRTRSIRRSARWVRRDPTRVSTTTGTAGTGRVRRRRPTPDMLPSERRPGEPPCLVAPDPRNPSASVVYRLAAWIAFTVMRLQRWRFVVHGLEHVPRVGGAVLATNHTSFWDFFTAGRAPYLGWGRPVRILAKESLFRTPVFGRIMRAAQHIPVHRGSGAEALRSAVAALQRGELVLVLPEQTISPSFELLPYKTGAARMAAAAGVPLIPAVSWGSHRFHTSGRRPRWSWRLPVSVAYGEPLLPTPDDDPADVTVELQRRSAALLAALQVSYPDGAPRAPGGCRRGLAAAPRRSRRPRPTWSGSPSGGGARPRRASSRPARRSTRAEHVRRRARARSGLQEGAEHVREGAEHARELLQEQAEHLKEGAEHARERLQEQAEHVRDVVQDRRRDDGDAPPAAPAHRRCRRPSGDACRPVGRRGRPPPPSAGRPAERSRPPAGPVGHASGAASPDHSRVSRRPQRWPRPAPGCDGLPRRAGSRSCGRGP
jgi:1-acyl-sn-glycerol-3-phosphate acyltransferase